MECPNCGAVSPDEARSCSACGTAIGSPPAEGSPVDTPPVPARELDQYEFAPTPLPPGEQLGGRQATDYGVQSYQRAGYTPPPVAHGQVPPPMTGAYYGGPRPNIPNHLVWGILTALFCCLPAGIVSIVYAARVNGKIEAGDLEGARRSSQSARTWAIISAALVVVYLAIIVMFVLSFSVTGS